MDMEIDDTDDGEYLYVGFIWKCQSSTSSVMVDGFNINVVKLILQKALKKVYGEVGGDVSFDILTYFLLVNYGIMRCRKSSYAKITSCMPLSGKHGDKIYHLRTIQRSPNIVSLLTNRNGMMVQDTRTIPKKRKLIETLED